MSSLIQRARLAYDARRMSPKTLFVKARAVETRYAAQLRRIAAQIGELVRGTYHPDEPTTVNVVERLLRDYADTIDPWAESVATRMVTEVAARDAKAWRDASRELSRSLGMEIQSAPIGRLLQERIAEQRRLITSLPVEAADRVQKLATEALFTGARSTEFIDEIMASGNVAKSRATAIARTETARTASLLNQVRCEHVGITAFRWQTARDSSVRKSHRELQGKIFEFANPPIVDGKPLIPGQIYNCRCFAEPILPTD